MTEFRYACTSSGLEWNFENIKELIEKLPSKQDTTPLTEKRVKEVTKPWNKEKDSGSKDNK